MTFRHDVLPHPGPELWNQHLYGLRPLKPRAPDELFFLYVVPVKSLGHNSETADQDRYHLELLKMEKNSNYLSGNRRTTHGG